jgi:hypothetical protein
MTDEASDLLVFLRARYDEDELWALAASAPGHGDGPTVAGGVHWTWAVGENWTPVDVDPTASYVGEPDDTGDVTLVTREVFPLNWDPRGLEHRVLTAEEMRTGDAGHIVRHDPARVLARVRANRRIIDVHESYGGYGEHCQTCHQHDNLAGDPWPCETLRLLAAPYGEHPGYRPEWRPDGQPRPPTDELAGPDAHTTEGQP